MSREDFVPATSIVEARAAQKALLRKLRHHRNVNGAGLTRYPDSARQRDLHG